MIKKHKNLEAICEELKDSTKYKLPESYDYVSARRLFTDHEVIPAKGKRIFFPKAS